MNRHAANSNNSSCGETFADQMNATHRRLSYRIALRLQFLAWIGLLLSACVTQTGCQLFGRFRNNAAEAPIVLAKDASLDQLIATISQQTARVSQLKTEVRVSTAGMPTLRGDLQVERPSRLRLQAGVMGISELGFDLGSNSDQFWIWKKAALPGDPPTLYFANHFDFQQSALREHTQIQPHWLIDALGLIEFDPSDEHAGPFPRTDGRVEIRSYSKSNLRPAVRIAVIDPRRGLVNQLSFYDSQGHRIAYLDSMEYQHYPEQNVSLPQWIVINIDGPDGQSTKLTVDANRFVVNSLFGDPALLWQMPNPPDVRRVDLSALNPVPVEPIGASSNAATAHESRAWTKPNF